MLKFLALALAVALPMMVNAQNKTQQLDISKWHKPLASLMITDVFAYREDHPTRHIPTLHYGLDFRSRFPEPVYAVDDGVISGINHGKLYGKIIEIDHGNGIKTRYAHLSKILSTSASGSTVTRGQIIGYSGDTGSVTWAHLHFEIHINNAPIDPFPLYGKLPCKWDVNHPMCSAHYAQENGVLLEVVPVSK
jgi:murein DD-endopeptidase MepM/ murein hydrolase activator NlpD